MPGPNYTPPRPSGFQQGFGQTFGLDQMLPQIFKAVQAEQALKDENEQKRVQEEMQRGQLAEMVMRLPPEARSSLPEDVLRKAFDPLEAWKIKQKYLTPSEKKAAGKKGKDGAAQVDQGPPPMSSEELLQKVRETPQEKTVRLTQEAQLKGLDLENIQKKIETDMMQGQGLSAYIAKFKGNVGAATTAYLADRYPDMAETAAKLSIDSSPEAMARNEGRILEDLRKEAGEITPAHLQAAKILARMQAGDLAAAKDLNKLPGTVKSLALKNYELNLREANDLRSEHVANRNAQQGQAALEMTRQMMIPLEQSQQIVQDLWAGKKPSGISKKYIDTATAIMQGAVQRQADADLASIKANNSGVKMLQEFANQLSLNLRSDHPAGDTKAQSLRLNQVNDLLSAKLSELYGFEWKPPDDRHYMATLVQGLSKIPGTAIGAMLDSPQLQNDLRGILRIAPSGFGIGGGLEGMAIPGEMLEPQGPKPSARGDINLPSQISEEQHKFLDEASAAIKTASQQTNLTPELRAKLITQAKLLQEILAGKRPFTDLLNATGNKP